MTTAVIIIVVIVAFMIPTIKMTKTMTIQLMEVCKQYPTTKTSKRMEQTTITNN